MGKLLPYVLGAGILGLSNGECALTHFNNVEPKPQEIIRSLKSSKIERKIEESEEPLDEFMLEWLEGLPRVVSMEALIRKYDCVLRLDPYFIGGISYWANILEGDERCGWFDHNTDFLLEQYKTREEGDLKIYILLNFYDMYKKGLMDAFDESQIRKQLSLDWDFEKSIRSLISEKALERARILEESGNVYDRLDDKFIDAEEYSKEKLGDVYLCLRGKYVMGCTEVIGVDRWLEFGESLKGVN